MARYHVDQFDEIPADRALEFVRIIDDLGEPKILTKAEVESILAEYEELVWKRDNPPERGALKTNRVRSLFLPWLEHYELCQECQRAAFYSELCTRGRKRWAWLAEDIKNTKPPLAVSMALTILKFFDVPFKVEP